MIITNKGKSKLITIKHNIEHGREETIHDERYIVYPVVILTEGVHAGSGGPTLYTAEELSKFVESWNGVPVTLQHPDINGTPVSANSPEIYENQVMGTLFNTIYQNGKLKAEIWLRNTMIDLLTPGLRNSLMNGERLEVSTGLFCEDNQVPGTFNNVDYTSIATNIRPDHLALLPGGTGACSWEDGCGVRANNKEGGEGMIRKKKMLVNGEEKQWDKFFVNTEEFTINELEYTQILDILSSKIDSMDVRGEKYNYLKKAYPSYVIYSINYRESNEPNKTVKRNYRIVNDVVEWTSDPVQVIENITYTEINNNSKKEKKEMEIKTMKECCPDKVDELIKNNSNFTDEHKESLLGMTEDQFALTINVAKDVKVVAKDVKVVDNATPTHEEKPITMNDLPKEMQDSINYGNKVLAQNKATLIAKIKTNKNNSFSDEDLDSFDLDMLDKLSNMSPIVRANYAPNGGSPETSGGVKIEPLPITNSWEEEEKK